MDYEKVLGENKFPTYEELKTGLIRLIDEGKISREDASRLLPELRESEDERIRKKLYNTVMGTPNDSTWFDGTSKEAMLAWLEKQKESLHISESCKENADSFTDEDEKIRKELLEYFNERNSYRDEDETFNGVPFPSIIAYLEKQKEPSWKPSEEQIQAIKHIVASIPPNYLKEQKYTMGLVCEVISNLEKL